MLVTVVQDILYGITALGVAFTLWHVTPRPWRRSAR